MDRFVCLLQLLTGVVFLSTAGAQQPPGPVSPPPPPAAGEEGAPPELKERWRKLPPEEREHFSKNLKKWENLSDAEKQRLRERGKQMFEQGRKEIEKLISELSVELSPERREEFIKAYLQKRREIERKIREETEPRRKELLAGAAKELKKEFGGKAEPTPTGTPVAIPPPTPTP